MLHLQRQNQKWTQQNKMDPDEALEYYEITAQNYELFARNQTKLATR